MNQKETAKLAEVVERLRRGPGSGWLESYDLPRASVGVTAEQREERTRLWLNTWILPDLVALVERYTKKKGDRRG